MVSERKKAFEAKRKQGYSLPTCSSVSSRQAESSIRVSENWGLALRVLDDRSRHSANAAIKRLHTGPVPNHLVWYAPPVIRGHVPHLHDKSSGKDGTPAGAHSA